MIRFDFIVFLFKGQKLLAWLLRPGRQGVTAFAWAPWWLGLFASSRLRIFKTFLLSTSWALRWLNSLWFTATRSRLLWFRFRFMLLESNVSKVVWLFRFCINTSLFNKKSAGFFINLVHQRTYLVLDASHLLDSFAAWYLATLHKSARRLK